jgi:hypothetical protein
LQVLAAAHKMLLVQHHRDVYYKTFYCCKFCVSLQARVFTTVCNFIPNLIFAGKGGAYPSGAPCNSINYGCTKFYRICPYAWRNDGSKTSQWPFLQLPLLNVWTNNPFNQMSSKLMLKDGIHKPYHDNFTSVLSIGVSLSPRANLKKPSSLFL